MDYETKGIEKWVTALRSGKYKQGRGTMQKGDAFCCLGVACKVSISPKLQNTDLDGELKGRLPHSDAQPNAPEWLQKINKDFSLKTELFLHTLNDLDRLTFDEIADCLEAVYILKVLD